LLFQLRSLSEAVSGTLFDYQNARKMANGYRFRLTLFWEVGTISANTLFYRKRHAHILQTYQEATLFANEVSPLLRGRIYSGLGSAQATLGQKQEALYSLGLAHETYPDHPEEDTGFLYTYTNHYILFLNEALTHLHFDRPVW
jgi:hypothetical protein